VVVETAGSGESLATGAKDTQALGGQKKRRRLKKVRISDALRHEGLDERELAKTLKSVIDRQVRVSSEDDPDDKFLASTVMGCFRYFDDGPSGGGPGHAPVKLLHDVPRPKRAGKTRKKKAKGRKP